MARDVRLLVSAHQQAYNAQCRLKRKKLLMTQLSSQHAKGKARNETTDLGISSTEARGLHFHALSLELGNQFLHT